MATRSKNVGTLIVCILRLTYRFLAIGDERVQTCQGSRRICISKSSISFFLKIPVPATQQMEPVPERAARVDDTKFDKHRLEKQTTNMINKNEKIQCVASACFKHDYNFQTQTHFNNENVTDHLKPISF